MSGPQALGPVFPRTLGGDWCPAIRSARHEQLARLMDIIYESTPITCCDRADLLRHYGDLRSALNSPRYNEAKAFVDSLERRCSPPGEPVEDLI